MSDATQMAVTLDSPPFRAGQTVELRSGSPTLTVLSCDHGQIYVAWFDDEKEVHFGHFPFQALKEIHGM